MATATKKKTKKTAIPSITATFAQFDSPPGQMGMDFAVERNALPIAGFVPLTLADYCPRGGTPLLDATAGMIAHMDAVQKAAPDDTHIGILVDRSGSMGGKEQFVVSSVNEFVGGMAGEEVDPEAAGKVLILIVTDGGENSSKEATSKVIQEATEAREERGWSFIYMGANQDAWAVAHGAGLAVATSIGYEGTAKGTANAVRTTARRGRQFISSNAAYLSSSDVVSGSNMDESGRMFKAGVEIDPLTGKPVK